MSRLWRALAILNVVAAVSLVLACVKYAQPAWLLGAILNVLAAVLFWGLYRRVG